MSKTTVGREPISVIEISQDLCQETWSLGNCQAGNSNYITSSEEFAPTAGHPWTMPNWEGTAGQTSGPTGSSDRIEFERTATTASSEENYVSSIALPTGTDLRFRGYFKKTDGTKSNNVVRIYIETSTGEAGAAMDYTDGDTANGVEKLAGGGALESFTSVTSTDAGSGWWLLEITLAASRTVASGSFGFEFSYDATTTGTGINVSLGCFVSAAQMAIFTRQGQTNYIGTTGTAVIATSDEPCFNTRQTCQDPANYNRGVQVLKFVSDRSPTLDDDYYFPMLANVSVSPAELNPGGNKRSVSGLGKRATLTANFIDAPHTDRIVDPYIDQRSYDPLERSTFWAKWRARNPYYINRPIKLKTGYLVDGALTNAVTREYVITDFAGPDSSGRVQIKAKDVLSKAENAKAQAPNANTGKLGTAISETETIGGATTYNVTLTPTGIGDLEYSASGTCRIKKEIFDFTRSGDTMTLTERSQQGSDATAHDTGEVVQECLVYTSQNCSDILYDLLNVYAGIDASFLNKTAWDTEQAAHLPTLYTATISEPTGVGKLISEMCEQMYFSTWWDERTSKVEIKAVRSAQGEDVTDLTDDYHFIEDSVSWTDDADELVTQVWIFYGQINPTVKLEQESNYATVEVVADFDAEGDARNQTSKIKKIYSRWISASNTVAATRLGDAMIGRYSGIPRTCTFSLDAKDGDLWLGDFIRIENRLNVNIFGETDLANLQILRANENMTGTEFRYTAQQYLAPTEFDPTDVQFPIAADLLNVNLRSLYEASLGTPADNSTIVFIVRSGVTIGGDAANYTEENISVPSRGTANDTYDAGTSSLGSVAIGTINMLQRAGISTPRTTAVDATYAGGSNTADYVIKEYPITSALQTGDWSDTTGITLKLVIEAGGQILGEGGNGSAHSFKQYDAVANPPTSPYLETVKGGDGGHAMKIDAAIEITNNGIIGQGCGGGGAVGWDKSGDFFIVSGGGGAGSLASQVTLSNDQSSQNTVYSSAAPGTDLNGGQGLKGGRTDSGLRYNNNTTPGVPNGFGGSMTDPDGKVMSFGGLGALTAGEGGTAGDCVVSGGSNITWITTGTRYGDINA